MQSNIIKILSLILALCAGIGSYSLYKLQHEEVATNTVRNLINQPRPDFTLYDIDKKLRNINEWDGKVTILNFWGTWCPPCIKEIPDLNAFYAEYKDKNIDLIGIAHDTPDKVREFMQKIPMQYTQLVDPLLTVELSKLYGNELGTLPYTVVIDSTGYIKYIHRSGIISKDELSHIVEPLL